MPTLRAPSFLLCVSLLVPACGDSGGGSTEANDSTDSTINTTDSAPTEVTSSSSSTSVPTTTEDSSSTDAETETDTDAVDPSTGTTGEPDPCAGLVAPEPANTFLSGATLFHDALQQEHTLSLWSGDDFDNSWGVSFELGADEPVVGVLMELQFGGDEVLGRQTTGADGTVTLEIVSITPECVTGRISDVAVLQDTFWVHEQLAGGFVASRHET